MTNSPYINRFLQPDTIIPDLSNPQSWNRFSYTLNNPVAYIDSDGHAAGPFLKIVVGILSAAAIVWLDTIVDPRGHGMNTPESCTDSYATCFENRERLKLNNMQNLNKDEFEGLLDSIYNDVNKFWRTPIDPSRSTYDTPFWDGNPRFGKPKYQDDVVCLDGKCSPRSAINYIGQGMYSAETGQSPQMAELTVSAWNWLAWGHAPTEDELYWMEYGYKAHQEREKKANQSESKGAPRKRPLTSNALIEAY